MVMEFLGQSLWRRKIMSRIVEVDTREWRDARMRETAAAVHGNTARYNKNPLIPIYPEEGFKKKRSHPVESGYRKLWAAAEIGDIVFSGRRQHPNLA